MGVFGLNIKGDKMNSPADIRVAYISMGIGINGRIPTVAGGLEILSGDTARVCADKALPVAFFSLVSYNGYFRQRIEKDGTQKAEPDAWNPLSEGFSKVPYNVEVTISGRTVKVGAWAKTIVGERGEVPVYLLDTNVEGNSEWDKSLTDFLYDQSGDKQYMRLCQEAILGIGAVKMVRALGYAGVETFHLNDCHPALAGYELLKENRFDLEKTRRNLRFTTHTPVQAGFDSFSRDTVAQVLGEQIWHEINGYGIFDGRFNMAQFALTLSRGVNAVSKLNARICRRMPIFKGREVIPITNGIHAPTWVSPELGQVYSDYLGNWRENPELFERADEIPLEAILEGRSYAEVRLARMMDSDERLPIIGFGRRAATYKRGDLLFEDEEALLKAVLGRYQLVFGMKAHPVDEGGKRIIKNVWQAIERLREKEVQATFVDDYNMARAPDMLQGATIWLNNPQRHMEACGTSGMKVAVNGGWNVSVLDGWWYEGYNGQNGFAIAPLNFQNNDTDDRLHVLQMLEGEIKDVLADMTKREIVTHNAIRLGAHFNTGRMVEEYAIKVWGLDLEQKVVSSGIDLESLVMKAS